MRILRRRIIGNQTERRRRRFRRHTLGTLLAFRSWDILSLRRAGRLIIIFTKVNWRLFQLVHSWIAYIFFLPVVTLEETKKKWEEAALLLLLLLVYFEIFNGRTGVLPLIFIARTSEVDGILNCVQSDILCYVRTHSLYFGRSLIFPWRRIIIITVFRLAVVSEYQSPL